MTNCTKKKRFGCIEMMHEGAVQVQKELAGKSIEEQLAYWRESTRSLRDRQARLRKKAIQVRERE